MNAPQPKPGHQHHQHWTCAVARAPVVLRQDQCCATQTGVEPRPDTGQRCPSAVTPSHARVYAVLQPPPVYENATVPGPSLVSAQGHWVTQLQCRAVVAADTHQHLPRHPTRQAPTGRCRMVTYPPWSFCQNWVSHNLGGARDGCRCMGALAPVQWRCADARGQSRRRFRRWFRRRTY